MTVLMDTRGDAHPIFRFHGNFPIGEATEGDFAINTNQKTKAASHPRLPPIAGRICI